MPASKKQKTNSRFFQWCSNLGAKTGVAGRARCQAVYLHRCVGQPGWVLGIAGIIPVSLPAFASIGGEGVTDFTSPVVLALLPSGGHFGILWEMYGEVCTGALCRPNLDLDTHKTVRSLLALSYSGHCMMTWCKAKFLPLFCFSYFLQTKEIKS